MIKLKYGFREHRSTLKESLKTAEYISKRLFNANLGRYDYYGFDNRCNQILFINIENGYTVLPTWLFIEVCLNG